MMMDLSRFTQAHKEDFETAYREISGGRKESHWMWYIFPQIDGLTKNPSYMNKRYSIQSLEEAKVFLADPCLGGNLSAICEALLSLKSDNAYEIFGGTDTKKLRSSMTLFSCASGGDSVFDRVLEKFFNGQADHRTLEILGICK